MSYRVSIHHATLSGVVHGNQRFRLSAEKIKALQDAAITAWENRKNNETSVRFLLRCTDNFFSFMTVFANPKDENMLIVRH
ncbi:hypothetical protein [Caviibacterium pharyngocola]|uniref:Uncharacterized protein n=1 Tax=Caviibacterium pharyngocola TaxID=28159 RepID=A0A2M8RV68_9PAST|nr:hypothetical protein [Caviibacterium pharyngocola]PJG82792.1 hypothetical protein CVP04_07465 [Caviibacterium pharyngocola]